MSVYDQCIGREKDSVNNWTLSWVWQEVSPDRRTRVGSGFAGFRRMHNVATTVHVLELIEKCILERFT